MITVVGNPSSRRRASGILADGLAPAIARAAAEAGQVVQLIGRVREGRDGDGVLLSLAASGVGHVAVLRDLAPAGVEKLEAPSDALDESVDVIADRDGEV